MARRYPVNFFDSLLIDDFDHGMVTAPGGQLHVLVAWSELQRSRGVRGVDLGPFHGMLFDAGYITDDAISMTDVPHALDVAWVAADRRVLAVKTLGPDSGVTPAPAPYRWALETRPGYLSAAGVVPGAQLWIDT